MIVPARTYTPDELEALRHVVTAKWLFGRYRPVGNMSSGSYKESDRAVCVEEMVRTHMMAGHTAEMLLASEPIPPDRPIARS